MFKCIHVIVNPVAGQDKPILGTLNKAFHPAGIDWEVKVTKKAGDARRYAHAAAKDGADAVGVYGGDGTVMEVASALVGSELPLAIFPGGTANVMSVELGIPGDLAQALALVCGDEHDYRMIDMGQVNDNYFLLRVGTGFEADLVKGADRETKNKLGSLAYILSAIQALKGSRVIRYHLTLDGKPMEAEGITCMVANSGSIGSPGLSLAPNISVSDGLLDVVVIRAGDIGSVISVAASVIAKNEIAEPLQHWQAREIKVTTELPQPVQADGELIGETPTHVKVIPQCVRVIVPKKPEQPASVAERNAAKR
jgi:diacylglycerol kinase (ATP)